MRRHLPRAPLALLPFVLAACAADGAVGASAEALRIERTFDFGQGTAGWSVAHADYTPETAPDDVIGEARPLPAPLSGTGFFLSGTNRSSDLFIYAKTQLTDLVPGARYRIATTVDFATDAPSGCPGVGGPPGESVWVVAGASTTEPLTQLDGGRYRVTLARGNQAQGGPEGGPLGTIANAASTCLARAWEAKEVSASQATTTVVTADAGGTAWVLVGMDSGIASLSRIYLRRVTVRLTPGP